jgi:hypothetical protein
MQKYTLTFLSLILPICIYYLDINLLNGMWGDELIAGQYYDVGFPHIYVLCILFTGWLILISVVVVKWTKWLDKQR